MQWVAGAHFNLRNIRFATKPSQMDVRTPSRSARKLLFYYSSNKRVRTDVLDIAELLFVSQNAIIESTHVAHATGKNNTLPATRHNRHHGAQCQRIVVAAAASWTSTVIKNTSR